MKEILQTFWNKISGKEPFTQEGKLKFVTIACMVVHVILIELFTVFNCFVMVCYNLCAVAFYMYIITLVKKKKLMMGYILTLVEVAASVVLGVIFVGWHSAFQLYSFIIIPAAFFLMINMDRIKRKYGFPLAVTITSTIIVIGMYIYSTKVGPIYDIDTPNYDAAVAVPVFHIFNIVVGIVFLAGISHMFVLEMFGISDSMMAQNQSLERTASVDPLTSLFNRRHMEVMLDSAMEQAKTRGTLFSLIMGDIDNFKRINDTYGHECGDVALTHVAEIMHRCTRDGDAVCRWGGEEFLILVRGNQDIAVTVAERIRSAVEKESINYQGQDISFTITFGVTTYVPGYRMETLIRQADDHLYIGKTTGKNKVVV
ncbi:MAG: GGDEF domain-containing protein [Lachnospiraceae bacterium]|nr:GGDEF domain-containing protein [Candidatus Merdinaster equi]